MENFNIAELIRNLVTLSIFLIMLSLGLNLSSQHFQQLWIQKGLFIRSLIATDVLVPLIAILTLKLLPILPTSTAIAIALMAICPSAPMTLKRVSSTIKDTDFAGPIQFTVALLSIITIPLTAAVFRNVFDVTTGWDIAPRHVASQVLLVQILPLGLGLLINRFWSNLAHDLQRPLIKICDVLFPGIIILLLTKATQPLLEFFQDSIFSTIAIIIMVASSLAIGHWLGGPDEKTRTTLAIVTSMRNVGLALLLASSYAFDVREVQVAIAAYAVLTTLVSIPYVSWCKRRITDLDSSRPS